MLRSFISTLYPNRPAEFRSDFSLDESVRRLRLVVRPTIFLSLFEQSTVGRVDEDCVRLQRVIPLFGNSFKPIYVGRFENSADGVVLKGGFTTFTFSKLFMTVWFGFAAIWTLAALTLAIASFAHLLLDRGATALDAHTLSVTVFPLFGFAFIVAGYWFLRLCWWLSRGDIDFLSRTIAGALNHQAT